ncbi:MAG: formimidoylglutamase [Gemmataceae bacterium]|nr:formimidoylglutamase [Gemmataceae bacterium]MDW8267074.1 formimidoylglutamase [Gemmataceae bacterium]
MVTFWRGSKAQLVAGRAVLVGFPQDEGVRRNGGRPGAAAAPNEIRRWLYRLTAADAAADIDLALRPPVDLGNLRIRGSLEETQKALGQVVAALLDRGAIPIVLGGGHETAFGHYLGYAHQRRSVGIINIDAHLDVRPLREGFGHSGSPFRQAMEHAEHPLPGSRYACLAAQPHGVSRQHRDFVQQRGGVIRWRTEPGFHLLSAWEEEHDRLARQGIPIMQTIDADAVCVADVPGVSAPNPAGIPGCAVLACARRAGESPAVASLDLVEVNPDFDLDGRSARWAALVIWQFLVGLQVRPGI